MAIQTGTGKARDRKVLRARINSQIGTSIPVWYPEDRGFETNAAELTQFIRVNYGRAFGDVGSVGGKENRVGSWPLLLATQPAPGMLAAIEAAEAKIQSIADVSLNQDGEDVWTMGHLEVHDDIAPANVPESLQDAYVWNQLVIPYRATEVAR